MRRSRQLTTIGMGSALTMLLGSSLVALTSDTATSTGNQVASGTFRPPTHDLDIALVSQAALCADAVFAESTSAAFTAGNLDLDSGREVETGSDFCLLNAGTAPGRLTVQFTGVSDLETGCSPIESTVGADASCGTGPGELRPMLTPDMRVLEDDLEADCSFQAEELQPAPWSTFESGAQGLVSVVPPGQVCRVHLRLLQTAGASDAAKAAAQSDTVRWSVSFVLQD